MQTTSSPLRNGGAPGNLAGFMKSGAGASSSVMGRMPTASEREIIVAHIRRLMAEAEDFFLSQQHLLKMTYNELSNHVDQLKYRAQFFVHTGDGMVSNVSSGNRHQFSVPMPLNALSAASAAGGFPFGAGLSAAAALNDGPYHTAMTNGMTRNHAQNGASAVSATPLKANQPSGANGSTSPRFAVSPLENRVHPAAALRQSPDVGVNSFQVSGSNQMHGSGVRAAGTASGFTYSGSGVPIGTGTSTPPAKHLVLTTDSKSPSLSVLMDDVNSNNVAGHGSGVGGVANGSPINDWGSLSLVNNANNTVGNSLDTTQNMMASPQFTNTLSLDDLLARFVGAGGNSSSDGTNEAAKDGDDAAGVGLNARNSTGSGDGGVFSFDTLYEQLIGGEKSRSPDEKDGTDRFASIGFAVTSCEGGRPGSGGGGGAGLAAGSLFDRNASPSKPPTATAQDRRLFNTATQAFGTALAPSQNPSSTPTRPQQTRPSPSTSTSQAQRSQHADPASSTYALLNELDKKDVIPIDSIRSLCDHHLTQTVRAVYEKGRPKVEPIPDSGDKSDDPSVLGIDKNSTCQVLVEFKRKRVLQYDSDAFVSPGSYVVVGGDRGEDLGLVIYTWCETTSTKKVNANGTTKAEDNAGRQTEGRENTTPSAGAPGRLSKNEEGKCSSAVVGIGLAGSTLTRSIGVGNGTVLRLATEGEVAKLLGVQAELETRAVDVCGQRVLDHALPMVIVDAEYQFDKKKLTFFYEAQQRMDFRELVRDLYKTFRARIWMELVDV